MSFLEVYKELMHSFIAFPFFLKYLPNAEYVISRRPVASEDWRSRQSAMKQWTSASREWTGHLSVWLTLRLRRASEETCS